jgi:hypothetical protein
MKAGYRAGSDWPLLRRQVNDLLTNKIYPITYEHSGIHLLDRSNRDGMGIHAVRLAARNPRSEPDRGEIMGVASQTLPPI